MFSTMDLKMIDQFSTGVLLAGLSTLDQQTVKRTLGKKS